MEDVDKVWDLFLAKPSTFWQLNDLFNEIRNVKIKMFADDCVLYTEGPTWKYVYPSLQDALNVYIDWGTRNYFELNASKTKAMLVGTGSKLKSINDPAPFTAGNSKILFVKSFVYLGTTLDSELTLEPLFKNVCRQVDQKLFILRKTRRYITVHAAKSMYKQMLLPLFDYNGIFTGIKFARAKKEGITKASK